MKKYIAMPIITLILAIVFLAIPTYAAGGNANLSALGIKPNDFSGFKESKTEYEATVPNSTKEVEVYAKAKDSKAKITGTGKLKLQEGQNTAKVVVKASDGTQKTYTINIKRLKVGEKDNTQKNQNTTTASTKSSTKKATTTQTKLQNLKIEGCELEPAFNKETYQYKVNYNGELTKLNIEANAENLNVQIIGNDELEDGENVITVLVSDEAEENATTYQINVSKNIVKETDFKDFLKKDKVKLAIKIAAVVVGAIIILVILIVIVKKIKNRHKDKKEEQDDRKSIEFEELVEELNKKEEKRKKDRKKGGRHSK